MDTETPKVKTRRGSIYPQANGQEGFAVTLRKHVQAPNPENCKMLRTEVERGACRLRQPSLGLEDNRIEMSLLSNKLPSGSMHVPTRLPQNS